MGNKFDLNVKGERVMSILHILLKFHNLKNVSFIFLLIYVGIEGEEVGRGKGLSVGNCILYIHMTSSIYIANLSRFFVVVLHSNDSDICHFIVEPNRNFIYIVRLSDQYMSMK